MSAALAPTTDLLAVIDALHAQHLRPATEAWRLALLAARASPADVDRCAVALIIAAEALADAAKHCEQILRREVVASMERDGVTGFETDFHSVIRANGARRPQVLDTKALAGAHPELMVVQEPKPDLAEIGRRLKAREIVTGCSMSNGGAPVLRITAKS